MTDKNIVTSSSLNLATEAESETPKSAPTKKAAVKKAANPKSEKPKKSAAAPVGIKDGHRIIYFESGTAYTVANSEIRFTREIPMQEIPENIADLLLEQENFRLPTQAEVDDYFNSKEE